MQQNKTRSIGLKLPAMIVLSAILFSFSFKKGGDSFEIYLNNKMIVQQYVSQSTGVKSFQLDQGNASGQVDIYYSHCGETGVSRNIIIKDGQNNVLKEWHFPDVSGSGKSMAIKVKDILNLQKNNSVNKVYLYYSSKQLPNARLLATILLVNDNKQVVTMNKDRSGK